MYLSGKKRGGLGQEDGSTVTPASFTSLATSPVNVQLSPMVMLGIGLLAAASLYSFMRKTTKSISGYRKKRARRAQLKEQIRQLKSAL